MLYYDFFILLYMLYYDYLHHILNKLYYSFISNNYTITLYYRNSILWLLKVFHNILDSVYLLFNTFIPVFMYNLIINKHRNK